MSTELEEKQEANIVELEKVETAFDDELIPDVVQALADVQEGMPDTALRANVALPSKRGGSHLGPPSYRQLSDMMHSTQALQANIKDATFVEGISTLIRNDVLANTLSLYTLGEFCVKVEELALTDEEAFVDILCAFCDDPIFLLDREVTIPDPKVEGGTMTVINATRKRLAHALYHGFPDWLTAEKGETPKGEKRIENACGKYRRVLRDAEIVQRQVNDAKRAQFPDVPNVPTADTAAVEAKKSKISSAASKYWIQAYKIADTETQTFLINSAIAYGFDPETVHKWRNQAVDGLTAKELVAAQATKEEKQN